MNATRASNTGLVAASRVVAVAVLPLLLLSAHGIPCLAQGNPGTNLTVVVKVVTATQIGDTTHVRYVLANQAQSQESLFTFTVDAPATVLSIIRPGPRTEWSIATVYRQRSVAGWAVLGRFVVPGDSTPTLEFSARGLPTVVSAWYRGHYSPPATFESDPDTANYVNVPDVDPLIANSVETKTVGVGPIAPGTSDSALIVRLGNLRGQACSLTWITDATLCSSLQAKLDRAARDLEHGRNAAAKTDLQSFNDLLTANHGAGTPNTVGDSAFWLLKVNADYVIGRL